MVGAGDMMGGDRNVTSPIIHSYAAHPIRAAERRRIGSLAVLGVLLLACAIPALASEALVLRTGGSSLMTFSGMKRVAVIDPAVADVIVSSLSELIVVGKAPGQTKIYVWDRAGRHEYAVVVALPESAHEVAKRLEGLLDPALRVKVLDDKTLVVDGQVRSPGEVDRAEKLLKSYAGTIQIVDLVSVEGSNLTPAERGAAALKKLLGSTYEYTLLGTDTVVVEGQAASPQEAERVQKILATGDKDFKVLSLVTYAGEHLSPEALAAVITEALGSPFKAKPLKGRQIVVEGMAPDEPGLKRVKTLLAAFDKDAEIVDLTTIRPEPQVSLEERIKTLQVSLGDQLKVRSLENRAIVVEGSVPSIEEAANARKVLAAVGQQIPVVDLITVSAPTKRQVVVRARVAEVNTSLLRNFGVEFGQNTANGFQGQPIVLDSRLQMAFDRAFNVAAVQDNNHSRNLAEPNLLVNDGDEAKLQVGGEVPIPVAQPSGGGTTISVEYKTYGIIMTVTPKILAKDSHKIELKVEVESSQLDKVNSVTLAGFQIPGLTTRHVTTVVTMADKATLMLGGLISHDQSRFVRKIPILADIPIIGRLFRSEQFSTGKTDLIIMVTPEVAT